MEWQEYICDAAEFGFNTPNLRSYIRGCPRTPPEVLEKLRAMKREFEKSVEAAKKANENLF
jgi:Ni,Fe-hydrogenase III small subunit